MFNQPLITAMSTRESLFYWVPGAIRFPSNVYKSAVLGGKESAGLRVIRPTASGRGIW